MLPSAFLITASDSCNGRIKAYHSGEACTSVTGYTLRPGCLPAYSAGSYILTL